MSNPWVIAIVDDDEAVREALCDFLQVEGLSARMFDRAEAFIAEAAGGDFGCLITDVCMPAIDGLELQHRLSACDRTIPVIFVTSSSDEITRARALRAGAAGWFSKPVDDQALLSAIRAALRRGC